MWWIQAAAAGATANHTPAQPLPTYKSDRSKMKKVLIKSLCAIFLASMSAASCQMLNPGPLPEDIVGDTPGELQAKIGDILAQAGTDSTKVEFAEIRSEERRVGKECGS